MTHRIRTNDLNAQFPSSPEYEPGCAINVAYKTFPESGSSLAGSPQLHNVLGCESSTHPTHPCISHGYEDIATGPASIKHLYTGVGNYYPPQRIRRPVNSLYGSDLSQFAPNGRRLSYHYKVWPLTHRHSREVVEQAQGILPYMDNREWTRHPVETDVGAGRWYP